MVKQIVFNSANELVTTMTRYLKSYNYHIPQRNIAYLTPIHKLKKWYKKKPELFKKNIYDLSGLDTYLMKYQLHPTYQHLLPLVNYIEDYFQNATEVLHAERNEIRSVKFNDEDYVIKSFKIPNIINRFAYSYLRASKAKRSYQYSLKLGEATCPDPVAYIEEFQSGGLSRSYFISRHFHYDFTIRPLLDDDGFDNRTEILQKFAEFTYGLHQRGILHRDYSPGNILIKKHLDHYQFNIIDVNRMQFKTLTLQDRLTNFARLMVDDATMKVILDRYAEIINKSEREILAKALEYRDQFAHRRRLKNKLRGRG